MGKFGQGVLLKSHSSGLFCFVFVFASSSYWNVVPVDDFWLVASISSSHMVAINLLGLSHQEVTVLGNVSILAGLGTIKI